MRLQKIRNRLRRSHQRHPQLRLITPQTRRLTESSLPQVKAKNQTPEGSRRMARAQEIQIIDTAFLVGKRRPLTDFPWWKRQIVRAVYFFLGWSNGDAVEVQAICTDRELAADMANKPGWFFVRLPINTSLPDEPCQFREQEFPRSDIAPRYERARPIPLEAVRVSDIEKLKELKQQVEELVRMTKTG